MARPPQSASAPCVLQVAPLDPAEQLRAASRIAPRPPNIHTPPARVRRARFAPTHPSEPGTLPAMPPAVHVPQSPPFASPHHPKVPISPPLPYPSTGTAPRWPLARPPACTRPVTALPISACSTPADRLLLSRPSPLHTLRSPLFSIACLHFLARRASQGRAGGVSTAPAAAGCSFPHAPRIANSPAWSLPGNRARHRAYRPPETSAAKECPSVCPSRCAPPDRCFPPAALPPPP